jgi:hypothetical protein
MGMGPMPNLPPAALALAVLLLVPAVAGCGESSGEGAGGSPDAPISTTVPGPGGGIPDLPRNEDPAAVQCTGPPRGVFDATEVVGESLAEAERAARREGCSVREVKRDGKGLAVTDDFRPDRVNVATEGGEVTGIVSIG